MSFRFSWRVRPRTHGTRSGNRSRNATPSEFTVNLLDDGVRDSRLGTWSLAVLMSAACLAGCTNTAATASLPPVPAAGPGSGTIVWLADPTAETATNDVRQVLADAFEQAYPSITVKLETGPTSTDALRTQLIRQLAAGSTPDVYDGDVIWPYSFAPAGYALPLSKYLPPSFWNTFGTGAGANSGASFVRDMTYNNDIYGVPEFIDEGFLYYREDLLAKAGLTPPRTWEELEHDALVLKSKGLPYQFAWQGNNYEGLTCDWYEFLADAFGGLPTGASPAADLDSGQALKALRFMQGLIAQGISPPAVDTFEETDTDSAFDSGHAAFMRGWDSAYANATSGANALSPDQVGVEAPPTFQGQSGVGWSTLGGWGLFINPRTRNLRAALTFVQWMAGRQAQWILATQYSEIPANASVRNDPVVFNRNPVLQAAASTRVVLRPEMTDNYARLSAVIYNQVNAALRTPKSAASACVALLGAARQLDHSVVGGLSCPGASGAGK
jgi:multiple sugar transport system substrate-binding protein